MKQIKIADFRIIRKANKTNVTVKDIPNINYVIFNVDGKEVIAKKNHNGRLIIKCSCPECSIQGIRNGTNCRRQIAVYKLLIKLGGRIVEGDISKPQLLNISII